MLSEGRNRAWPKEAITICLTNLITSFGISKIFLIAEQLETGKGRLRRRLDSKFYSHLLRNLSAI